MESQEISDFDIAILDSLKAIIEVLAAKGVATHDEFALPLANQHERAIQMNNGHAAAVFQILVSFCKDPERAQARALIKEPPQGTA